MGYRNLLIESNVHINCKQKQLIITSDSSHSVPLEDITSIVLENLQSTVTIATLSQLAQAGVTVYICDQKHLPCAIAVPFAQHSRNTGMIRLQESLSEPTKKRLWQQIVQTKIANQAKCLKLLDKNSDAEYLNYLVKTVNSGDTNNVEAAAANYYFKALFDEKFYRGNDADARNSYLNYGYAIIRGHISRLITSYGFLPMKGLHHKSEQNSFNLADDFIEPFRPIVDLFTAKELTAKSELDPAIKRALYNVLNLSIKSGNQIHSVAYATERMVQSFNRCCQKTSKELLLPTLIELRQHAYE